MWRSSESHKSESHVWMRYYQRPKVWFSTSFLTMTKSWASQWFKLLLFFVCWLVFFWMGTSVSLENSTRLCRHPSCCARNTATRWQARLRGGALPSEIWPIDQTIVRAVPLMCDIHIYSIINFHYRLSIKVFYIWCKNIHMYALGGKELFYFDCT